MKHQARDVNLTPRAAYPPINLPRIGDDHHQSMSQPPPPTPPPPVSPSKRLRASTLSPGESSERYSGSLFFTSWPSVANATAEKFDTLWEILAQTPMPRETTAKNLEGLVRVHSTLCGILDAVELSIRTTSKEFPGAADAVPPELRDAELPKPATPAPTSKPPTQPSKLYAQAAKPRRDRQKGPKPKPVTQKPPAPMDPVRVTIVLKDYPDLEARNVPFQTLYEQLLDAAAEILRAPTLLGVQWSKNQNMILAFPTGTSRAAIKSLFPSFRSVLGIEGKLNARFNVNWSYIHLANVRAKQDDNTTLISEDHLRQALVFNPAIAALNITVQPRWLCKPDSITGTHLSVILAFEDPDGLIERNLRKTRIYVYGEIATVKKWYTNPPGRGKGK